LLITKVVIMTVMTPNK